MRLYQWMLFAFVLLSQMAMAQMSGYEYWLDGDYDKRTFVENANGKIIQDLNVSDMVPGIHRYHFRAQDARGRWSVPFTHYFLRMGHDYSDNEVTVCEYAIDNGEWATCPVVGGQVDLELSVQRLIPGMHRLMLRFSDKFGRWSGSNAFSFLRLGGDYSDNAMCAYEYWLDGDYAARVEGKTSDGLVQLEMSSSDLSYGLHRFTFRAQDVYGRWSVPFSKYFVKLEPSLTDNKIIAYEYWFNSGWTTRVDVTPANPFSTDDLWIDIAGVVPNSISEEYTVDLVNSVAYCPDKVAFGLRFGDRDNRWTEVRTDTFDYQVPVQLDFQPLSWNDSVYITNPHAGEFYAYEVVATQGDSLVWNIGGDCRMDIYTEQGERLCRLLSSHGSLEHNLEITCDGRLFALVYDVKQDSTIVSCRRTFTTGVSSTEEERINVSVDGDQVTVSGANGWTCTICHLQGYIVGQRPDMTDLERIVLAKGVYVIHLVNAQGKTYVRKISIP